MPADFGDRDDVGPTGGPDPEQQQDAPVREKDESDPGRAAAGGGAAGRPGRRRVLLMGLTAPAGATLSLRVGGPVTAVSATSITLGGGGHTITAAVTKATAITGKVTSISGIKAGDLVSLTASGAATAGGQASDLTATAIQDPARLPSAPGQ